MRVQLFFLFVLLIILVGIFLIGFEQWDTEHLISDTMCTKRIPQDGEEEVIFVTVTVTVTPIPIPENEKEIDTPTAHWKTSHWCIRNPDYSEICFYDNICFDGMDTILFLDPKLSNSESSVLYESAGRPDLHEDAYRISTHEEDSIHDHILPFINSETEINVILQSSRGENLKSALIEDGVFYFAFQHDPEEFHSDWFHFIKDNIMLWEVQRLNTTFSSFIHFPPIDNAMILRNRLPEGVERDLLQIFTQSHTRIWYWEDLAQNLPSINPTRPLCMEKAMIIGSKPQFFSGPSEGEAFKTHLYEQLSLQRPKPRGFDREEDFVPTVTIYNPIHGSGYSFGNMDQLEGILNHYQLRYSIINDLEDFRRLRELGELFYDTDVLISPHDVFEINYMWLNAHTSVIEVFPPFVRNNRFEVHSKALVLNYQPIRSWIRSKRMNQIEIPLREMELAIIEAFDMQAISIRSRAESLYINTGITFEENDWFKN